MKTCLTSAVLKTAQHQARSYGLRAELWDTRLENFFVQVRASGHIAFFVRFRSAEGHYQNRRLGNGATLSVAQARALARAVLAEQWLAPVISSAKAATDLARPPLGAPDPILAEAVKAYFIPYIQGAKQSWKNDVGQLHKHILPAFGSRRLSSIRAKDISAWLVALRQEKHLAPASCNHALFVLCHFFKLATELWGIATGNPCRKVKNLPVHNLRQVYLKYPEIDRLLSAARHPANVRRVPEMHPILVILLLTGARLTNTLRARWEEFDEARHLWHIPRTKSGQPQDVWLSEPVLDILLHLPSRGHSPWLFPNPYSATGEPYKQIYYTWKRVCMVAGLDHVRTHDLRHTFASMLIEQGFSLYVVQHALGHHSAKMTERYAHLADATLKKALDAVAEGVPGVEGKKREGTF